MLNRYLTAGCSPSPPNTSLASTALGSWGQLREHPNARGGGCSLVRHVYILDGQDCQVAVVSEVPKGDSGAAFESRLLNGLWGDVQRDGHAEEDATGESVLLDDTAGGACQLRRRLRACSHTCCSLARS